ncbi:C-8 sterol isomerase [Coprinopsis marcescibilis]|uniref:C-8 sterol isomerase n=1 Tax=Coprinopsis marcescibilis TaxID=230819 RepID=A0A5C3L6H9_COPMA|nr:C-8 sterol isomerase [Coprinopsis marcescibilis]
MVLFRWLDTIKDRWYIFDPETLHRISKSAVAAYPNNTAQMIEHIVQDLTETYATSNVRLSLRTGEWVLNNAGGAMGAFYVIHASITEYLIIFGTPLGTEGHTGSYPADDYFYVLTGEEWVFKPGEFEKRVYGPGSVNHQTQGCVQQYKMHEGCFALEYARGWIPAMLPFGFMDGLTSTLDFSSLYRMSRISAREIIGNLLIGKI